MLQRDKISAPVMMKATSAPSGRPRRRRSGRLLRWGLVGLAGSVALLSLTLASAMTWPLARLPLSSRLVAALETRADFALTATPMAAAIARRETDAALSLAPATSSGWLRLAYMQYRRDGRMSEAVQAFLDRSYDAAPIGPDVTAWRVKFVFETWDQINPALRRRALNEFVATSRWRGPRAREFADEIRNPNGRLALKLATAMARSHDPVQ